MLCLVALSSAGYASQATSAGGANPKTLKNPVRVNAASLERGEQVFQKYCRHCHGASGKGDGPQAPEGSHPADLTDVKWDHGGTDGEIYTTIRNGLGPKFDMTPYEGKITDEDIWNGVIYLRSIGPKPSASATGPPSPKAAARPSGR
jgi:mono/diheme cytochrome c family protein